MTPVAVRRYTLEEIDNMRAALYAIASANGYQLQYYNDSGFDSFLAFASYAPDRSRIEEELRTCMIGGVGLDELEIKREEAKAAKEARIAEFAQQETERRLRREYGPRE
jgi:hypothetical protein